MGLNDLVEKKGGKKQSGGVTPNYGNSEEKTVGWDKERDQVDYDKEEKPCPSCACLSPKTEDPPWWECLNPDCGVNMFMMGWNEFRSRGLFLGEIEVEGWRYRP